MLHKVHHETFPIRTIKNFLDFSKGLHARSWNRANRERRFQVPNMKKGTDQLCLTIPKEWFGELSRIARIKSAEEDRDINRITLIREAIAKAFGLECPREK